MLLDSFPAGFPVVLPTQALQEKNTIHGVVSSSHQSSEVIDTSVRTSKAPEFILRRSTHELDRSVPERVSSMTDVQVSILGS